MDISRPSSPRNYSLYCPDQDSIPVSLDTMIDEQSSESGHDYTSDRSAIGAGSKYRVNTCRIKNTFLLKLYIIHFIIHINSLSISDRVFILIHNSHMDSLVSNLLTVKLRDGEPRLLYGWYFDVSNVGVVRLG